MLVFTQVGQGEIFKQQVEIFIFGDIKDEFIFPFAILTGIALAASAATAAALWAFDAIVLHKVIVARMDALAVAAATLMKYRLINIINRNGYGFATFHIGNRTLIDGLGYRLLNLRLITAQKALAVNRALVLTVKTPIDEIGHNFPPNHMAGRPGFPGLMVRNDL